jgi:hypothetical protein
MEPQTGPESYEQEMQPVGGSEPEPSGGGGLSEWSGTLREINQILQQLNQMGLMQGMGPQQGQQQPQGGQQMQQPQQGSGASQGQANQIDVQVQQTFKQVQGGLTLLQQQDELGPEATLEETQKYVMQNEQQLKQVIKTFIQQQRGQQ